MDKDDSGLDNETLDHLAAEIVGAMAGTRSMELYSVEVQLKVYALSDEDAWRRAHDTMAYYLNGGTSDPLTGGVVDFELLDEAAILLGRDGG